MSALTGLNISGFQEEEMEVSVSVTYFINVCDQLLTGYAGAGEWGGGGVLASCDHVSSVILNVN